MLDGPVQADNVEQKPFVQLLAMKKVGVSLAVDSQNSQHFEIGKSVQMELTRTVPDNWMLVFSHSYCF